MAVLDCVNERLSRTFTPPGCGIETGELILHSRRVGVATDKKISIGIGFERSVKNDGNTRFDMARLAAVSHSACECIACSRFQSIAENFVDHARVTDV
jgi:hypothetical protein